MRKERRRWSSRLKTAPAEDVLALSIELFERFGYRWVTYELLVAHVKREVRSKLTTGLKNPPSRRRTDLGS